MDQRALILQLQAIKANAEALSASVDATLASIVPPPAAAPAPCQHAKAKDSGSTMGNPRAHCQTCDETLTGDEARRILGWPL